MSRPAQSEAFGQYVSLIRRERLVEVIYDRGDGLNALSIKGMTELKDVALMLAGDTQSSVIILTGQSVFSAGADLNDPDRKDNEQAPLLEQRQALKLGPDLCRAWAELEHITIAAIEGFCIGGGLALAVACDHRIAANNAHMRLPEVPLGMNMSWQSVPRLVALLGPSRAKQFIILGQKLTAETAHQWGLVDQITKPGGALTAAYSLAERYAALPPMALRMVKQAIEANAHPLASTAIYMDRDQFLLTRQTEDQTEAITSFLEKRTPKFSGN